MANQTITLKSQSIRHFGPSPSTRWNSFKWTTAAAGPGNGTWGMKSAACQGTASIKKNIFRTLSHSSMSVGISCPASSIFKTIGKVHSHSLTVAYANSDKRMTDGRGYFYVFPDRTTNIENEFFESFTCAPLASTTYTSGTVSTTTWT